MLSVARKETGLKALRVIDIPQAADAVDMCGIGRMPKAAEAVRYRC